MAATSSPTTRRLPTLAKYEVLEELGHGGMATVYRAVDKRLGREVAVKVIHPHLRDSKEVQSRFFVEAKAVAKLRHPNIVEVFDVSGEGEHEQYLVCELLRGRTLRKLLQQHGAIPPEVAAALALELLSALDHAHASGVVHRDVKPENVICEHRSPPAAPDAASANVSSPSGLPPSSERPGERVVVKLTDFGIAKLLDAQGVTSTGQVLGSPAHMAPEQIEGGEVDRRADVFGMGVLLYECMVGHLPFEGNNPAQVLRRVLDGHYAAADRERPEIGKAWSAILDRALARAPEDRWASAAEMHAALCAELKRVGIASPRHELEAWFDDPEAYGVAHKTRMISKMCELGVTARKAGRALDAAAAYNRALAYAPDDPQLLKVVAGMHRAEARARLTRRLVPALFAAVFLGVVAFFVTRAVRPRPPAPARPPASASLPPPREAPSSVASASGSSIAPRPSVSASVPSVALPTSARGAAPIGTAPPSPPRVRRTITLAKVRPVAGVKVAVDGDAAIEASSGITFALNEQAHTLLFTCIEELCEPQTRTVAAGDAEESVEVELKIKPARLVVAGDPSSSFVLREMPTLALLPNVPVAVPMTRKTERFHVRELVVDREIEVTLTAGELTRAIFSEGP